MRRICFFYQCLNRGLNYKIEFSFFYLESAPTWRIKPHNVTLYHGQRNYTLPCRTFGYPVPNQFWTKNGATVEDSDVCAGINDLFFYTAKKRHSGLYTCTASNVLGTISQSVYVKVVSGMVFGSSSIYSIHYKPRLCCYFAYICRN